MSLAENSSGERQPVLAPRADSDAASPPVPETADPRASSSVDSSGRRTFLKRSARLLVYVAPLIETFRARRVMAQSTAGSIGFSGGGT